MNWVTDDRGHRCLRHNETFPRGEVCQRCVCDPGDTATDDETESPDPVLEALRAEFVSRAKRCWRAADELLEGTNRDVSAACKASAEACKWERLALETYDRLTTKRDLALLIKKYRALVESDGGVSH